MISDEDISCRRVYACTLSCFVPGLLLLLLVLVLLLLLLLVSSHSPPELHSSPPRHQHYTKQQTQHNGNRSEIGLPGTLCDGTPAASNMCSPSRF
jgi:hypothetical protein